jgi:hypothetical protein
MPKKTFLRKESRRFNDHYEGVHCGVERLEYPPKGDDPGGVSWWIWFKAEDRETLILHGIATAEQFHIDKTLTYAKTRRHPAMNSEFGLETHFYLGASIYQILDDRDHIRFTKRLEGEVARMLRPFVRGSWRPPTEEART